MSKAKWSVRYEVTGEGRFDIFMRIAAILRFAWYVIFAKSGVLIERTFGDRPAGTGGETGVEG